MSEYKYMVDGYETMFNELKQENQKLKEALDVANEALEFYADRCKGHEGMAPQYNELNDLNCINENFGEIARQALSKLKALGIVKEGE